MLIGICTSRNPNPPVQYPKPHTLTPILKQLRPKEVSRTHLWHESFTLVET